jgi:membrane-bound lytic murein transglycosylase D
MALTTTFSLGFADSGLFSRGWSMVRDALFSSVTVLMLLLPVGTGLASPFVNTAQHPALTALQPVGWAMPNAVAGSAGAGAVSNAASTATSPTALPELTLSFVPEGPQNVLVQHGDAWGRIRAGFMMQPLTGKEVMEVQAWYAARPQMVTSILARSRVYLFHIVEEIRKRNMPMELALLPFIESGFDPMALSTAQASGLWQFIPETGLRYNLPQNAGYDARRDVLASTRAALDYLQFLYDMFRDWHLALAAYNVGEHFIARAIERNRALRLPTDFASLAMPAETRYYVPRLIAVKNLVANPQLFGLTLPHVPNEPYFTSVAQRATATGKSNVRIDIRDVARFADLNVEEFRALNAAHSDGVITVGATPLVVPLEKAQTFSKRFEAYLEREEARSRAEVNRKRLLIR